jgi:hypothetical protein
MLLVCRRSVFQGLLIVTLGLVFSSTSLSQTFGEITGVVTDASGAVVIGANVMVTNTQTNATRTAATNDVGNYSFPALLPGVYDVKVEMTGMQTEVRNGVELQVQQSPALTFNSRLGP